MIRRKTLQRQFATLFFASLCVCRLEINYPHNTNIPLVNNTPTCSRDSILDTLFFPESTLCTLSVSDLNDSILNVYSIPGNSDPFTDLSPWKASAKTVVGGLSAKTIILQLSGNCMGAQTGVFVIQDEQDGRCVVPYKVTKVMHDSFNSVMSGPSCWNIFNPGDQNHYKLVNPGPKLRLIFPANDTATFQSAGIMSSFCISGDLKIQVGYKLRDDMLNGFSVGFLLSSSADTSRWVERAGIFLSGNGDNNSAWVTVNAGVGINMARKNITTYDGVLQIQRSNGKILFVIKSPDSFAIADTIDKNFSFPHDSVYVQLRMSVDDFSRNRHCEWDNFQITSGTITFK
jgi:hypothetical protein